MIEAKELRIGNFILSNGYGENIIDEVDLDFFHDLRHAGFDLDNYYGIEIDEDWLEKFGFHYAPDCLIYGKSGWFKKLEYQDDPTYFFFNNHLQGSLFLSSDKIIRNHLNIHFECEYVHQFQNIYFSLTGQELTIK